MARKAIVVLKEGSTYRYKGYVFTPAPSTITDPNDIDYVKTIGCLNVTIEEDTPPAPAEEEAAEEPTTTGRRGRRGHRAEEE